MKNVVIYKRVSTDEQAEHGFSLDAQEEKVIKYFILSPLYYFIKKHIHFY